VRDWFRRERPPSFSLLRLRLIDPRDLAVAEQPHKEGGRAACMPKRGNQGDREGRGLSWLSLTQDEEVRGNRRLRVLGDRDRRYVRDEPAPSRPLRTASLSCITFDKPEKRKRFPSEPGSRR